MAAALGEPLRPDERAFLDGFGGTDPEIAAERELIRKLGETGEPVPVSGDRVRQAVDAWAYSRPDPGARKGRVLAAAATLGAVAAGILLWWGAGGAEPSAPPSGQLTAAPSAGAVIRDPAGPEPALAEPPRSAEWSRVAEDGRATPLADVVLTPARRTCLRHGEGAEVCLDGGSHLRVGVGARLELVSGRAKVVAVAHPIWMAVGGHVVRVRDARLWVSAQSVQGWSVLVEDGQATVLRGGEPVVRLGPGERFERSTPGAVDRGPIPSAAPAKAAVTRLAEARTLRAAGRYPEAARVLEGLLRSAPRSSAARTGSVILGNVYLGPLDDPRRALKAFDFYLGRAAQGAALEAEARYGRVRALRRLGRGDAAAREAARLRERFPSSPYARDLP